MYIFKEKIQVTKATLPPINEFQEIINNNKNNYGF